jgi:hypothetical protein
MQTAINNSSYCQNIVSHNEVHMVLDMLVLAHNSVVLAVLLHSMGRDRNSSLLMIGQLLP